MKQEITETLSDIREMMERSQKVLYINGTAGLLTGIWAIIGVIAVSLVIYGRIDPIIGNIATPIREANISTFCMIFLICFTVFITAFMTVWFMSKRKAKREGMIFSLDAGARHLLENFFTAIIAGGFICITPIFNGYWELIPGFMLVFYGLSLVLISPIALKFSITKYLGYTQILVGIAALCMPSYGLMFWAIGFGILHFIWGFWFYFCFDRN